MEEYLRDPVQNHSRVTVEQLHRADREVWRRLTLLVRGGVRRGADGIRPLDAAMPAALTDWTFRMLLLSLPSRSSGGGGAAVTESGGSKRKAKVENQAAEIRRLRARLDDANAAGQNGKGKGPGGKGNKGARGADAGKGRTRMPSGLIGNDDNINDND